MDLREDVIELRDIVFGFSEQIFITKIQLKGESFLPLDDVLEFLVLHLLQIVKCVSAAPLSALSLVTLINFTYLRVLLLIKRNCIFLCLYLSKLSLGVMSL